MSDCKGQVYEAVQNNYLDKQGNIVSKTTMILRKSLSCEGCEACFGLMEFFREYIKENVNLVPKDILSKYYFLTTEVTSTDSESGDEEHEPVFAEWSIGEKSDEHNEAHVGKCNVKEN